MKSHPEAASTPAPKAPLGSQVLLCVLALWAMAGLFYYALTYQLPSGKTIGLMGFVAIFFREAAIFLFGALALFAVLIAWLVQLVRRMLSVGKNAR